MSADTNAEQTQAYGSWPSPITAERLVEGAAGPGEIRADGEEVWWAEARPTEGGRIQLVRLRPGGAPEDVLPEGFSARTRVHEYGGAAWTVRAGVLVFANWSDQRLYRLGPGDDAPVAITAEPRETAGLRYADLTVVPAGQWGEGEWLVAVRESHEPAAVEAHGEAVNEIVALPLDGTRPARVLVTGPDFVSSPRPAADGSALAWTQWSHPDMPWDAAELMVAAIEAGPRTTGAQAVAGGGRESVLQPEWGPDGALWFASDRTGWWNLYRVGAGGQVEAVAPVEAEIGGPQWVFGERFYAFLDDGRIACTVNAGGFVHLGVLDPTRPEEPPTRVETGLTWLSDPAAVAGGVLVIGGGPDDEDAPRRVRLAPTGGTALQIERLRPARDFGFDARWFSPPRPIEFDSVAGRTAHALLYLPKNPHAQAPAGALPPLIVSIHGGPTAQAPAVLNLRIQYWTSRGFAVADVNYGGSTGYGREYRNLLYDSWGIVDVEDCTAVARHLADTGVVDGTKLAIRGGSAGGYTTLAALVGNDVFTAGASHFGVADIAALARHTHKFESRYLDRLVGPYPEAEAVYRARSPINHTDHLSSPLAVFQGLEDEVVPPAQAEMIVAALRDKKLPYVYLAFEGEQHGFRRAENIIRALEAELWFYGRVFDFTPADPIEPPPGGGF
ncbi:S9 family peptidase [Embleya hyalina]|uniref:Acyl-peptide hydrolase n=1 Tax=Embleya hyalina TaxID=516124 RepID=A0A401YS83_9ACTN|nr:prolyl oligopeptidase family serine peptidase [Embleya hyalina]GCD97439.1 acyl-peptide hydrolase [Embleya hyalina]